MKRFLLVLIVLSINLISAQKREVTLAEKKIFNELLHKTIQDKKFVGTVAGLSINGSIEWSGQSGYSDLKNKIKIDTSLLMRPASIAKPMTAIAIMQLVEQGKINLDVPIQTYLPEFSIKKEGTITVRHLLTHTSGISAYQSRAEVENKKNYASLREAMKVFENRNLLSNPGTTYSYTTYGYVVLGVVIENVSGLNFEEYMKKYIWRPAGMTNTGVEKQDVKYENTTLFYHKKKNGKVKLIKEPNNLSNRIPGGGFYTTVTDLLKFGNAIINNTLISASTTRMMLQNGGHKQHGNPYGFGWFLYGGQENPSQVFGHSGEQSGSSAQFMMSLETKTVFVVLANTSGSWKHAIALTVDLIKEFNENSNKSK